MRRHGPEVRKFYFLAGIGQKTCSADPQQASESVARVDWAKKSVWNFVNPRQGKELKSENFTGLLESDQTCSETASKPASQWRVLDRQKKG